MCSFLNRLVKPRPVRVFTEVEYAGPVPRQEVVHLAAAFDAVHPGCRHLISQPSEDFKMSIETILIIVLVVFLLGGGGWYWGRGRG